MLMDGLSGDSESKKSRKSRNIEKNVIIAQRFASKKWWRSTYLASGLALIWHSRLLSVLSNGGLQRWWSGEPNIAPAELGGSLLLSPILIFMLM